MCWGVLLVGDRDASFSPSRRAFLRRALLLGVALPAGLSLLSACSSAPPAAPAPTSAPAAAGGAPTSAPAAAAAPTPAAAQAAPTSAPAAGGRATTLIMAATEVAPNIDVEYALQNSAHYVWDQVHERLVEFGTKPRDDGFFELDFSKIEPRLAESWQIAPDGKSIVFTLRQGVKSQAGNELTADDVKYTWDRKFALKGIGGFFTGVLNLEGPDSVKVVDKYKVQFTASQPTTIFLSIMPQGYQGILDSTEFKKHATADDPWSTKWFANNTVSFGPYKLEQISPNREVTFTRHEGYYRDKPQMEKIIFRQVPASSNRVALLLSGDVDLVPDLLPRELQDLKTKTGSGTKVVSWVGNQLTSVVMNTTKPPFDKVEVRKAMNYATPYQDILQSVYFGLAQQMKSPYASIYPMATQEFWSYDTNLDKAKDLLKQGGYPDGFEAELAVNTAFPELEQLAVLMQTSMAKVGIKININKMPGAAFQERTSRREFPIFIQWEQANCPDPGYSLYLYYYSKSFLDLSDLKDAKFDGLVDQIRSTLDDSKRQGAAKDAQKILIQDDVPWVWLVHSGTHLAMRDNLKGLIWRTTNSFPLAPIQRA